MKMIGAGASQPNLRFHCAILALIHLGFMHSGSFGVVHLYNRGDKKNKNSKPLTKFNSTESCTRDMVLKFLPEPNHEVNILQKNYQALSPPDKLFMHLT